MKADYVIIGTGPAIVSIIDKLYSKSNKIYIIERGCPKNIISDDSINSVPYNYSNPELVEVFKTTKQEFCNNQQKDIYMPIVEGRECTLNVIEPNIGDRSYYDDETIYSYDNMLKAKESFMNFRTEKNVVCEYSEEIKNENFMKENINETDVFLDGYYRPTMFCELKDSNRHILNFYHKNVYELMLKNEDKIKIFYYCEVEKINWYNKDKKLTASSVLLKDKRSLEQFTIECKKVIICENAIETPKLLFRSGIGKKEEYLETEYENLYNLEKVGKNLKDTPLFPTIHSKYQLVSFILPYCCMSILYPLFYSFFMVNMNKTENITYILFFQTCYAVCLGFFLRKEHFSVIFSVTLACCFTDIFFLMLNFRLAFMYLNFIFLVVTSTVGFKILIGSRQVQNSVVKTRIQYNGLILNCYALSNWEWFILDYIVKRLFCCCCCCYFNTFNVMKQFFAKIYSFLSKYVIRIITDDIVILTFKPEKSLSSGSVYYRDKKWHIDPNYLSDGMDLSVFKLISNMKRKVLNMSHFSEHCLFVPSQNLVGTCVSGRNKTDSVTNIYYGLNVFGTTNVHIIDPSILSHAPNGDLSFIMMCIGKIWAEYEK